MPAKPLTPLKNRLLSNLDSPEYDQFVEQCTLEQLHFGQCLHVRDDAMMKVYFPLTCFISLLSQVDDKAPMDVALIGSEGMLGTSLLTGDKLSPLTAKVQGAGLSLCMPATLFVQQLRQFPKIRQLVGLYLSVQLKQLAQTAACLCYHDVNARLARWLLMSHDRAHSDYLQLTHQFLADMLGVRRSAITIAAGQLQQKNMIHYRRGRIHILSHQGLVGRSCGCYQDDIDSYHRCLPE
ncbi:Crp/Fnr family transcriptional regulator [Aliiglaciecola sp. CAU 1673]|uniref:Crp/Fnr family transcriptional regulator n=1 Tax=Aliiglaciecola sp. CAU 1673 TaxID=3032595 RepID=UPI0023DB8825|nr:Crp/Fnr family transcriptional regulator [Aliiglaciecola sp. CAU 1673]MDF2180277.1 Crp/Fnr family transcriptional regulator [Aliiglaciecola sp. CAU 1673]